MSESPKAQHVLNFVLQTSSQATSQAIHGRISVLVFISARDLVDGMTEDEARRCLIAKVPESYQKKILKEMDRWAQKKLANQSVRDSPIFTIRTSQHDQEYMAHEAH